MSKNGKVAWALSLLTFFAVNSIVIWLASRAGIKASFEHAPVLMHDAYSDYDYESSSTTTLFGWALMAFSITCAVWVWHRVMDEFEGEHWPKWFWGSLAAMLLFATMRSS